MKKAHSAFVTLVALPSSFSLPSSASLEGASGMGSASGSAFVRAFSPTICGRSVARALLTAAFVGASFSADRRCECAAVSLPRDCKMEARQRWVAGLFGWSRCERFTSQRASFRRACAPSLVLRAACSARTSALFRQISASSVDSPESSSAAINDATAAGKAPRWRRPSLWSMSVRTCAAPPRASIALCASSLAHASTLTLWSSSCGMGDGSNGCAGCGGGGGGSSAGGGGGGGGGGNGGGRGCRGSRAPVGRGGW